MTDYTDPGEQEKTPPRKRKKVPPVMPDLFPDPSELNFPVSDPNIYPEITL